MLENKEHLWVAKLSLLRKKANFSGKICFFFWL
jgi:hypothetical protein